MQHRFSNPVYSFYISVMLRLEEFRDILNLSSSGAHRFLGCFSHGEYRRDGFLRGNGKELPDFVSVPESHDQGGISQFCGLEDQIFVLQSQIVAAPAVAKLIVGSSVFLEACPVVYKGSNDQSGIFSLGGVALGETFPAETVYQILG